MDVNMNYIVISGVVLSLLVGGMWVYTPNNHLPDDLGIIDGHLQPLRDTPNGIASVTDQANKRVAAFPVIDSIAHSFDLIEQAARSYGEVRVQSRTTTYLHLVFTTPRMRFHDDVEWLANASGTIDVRSQSRIGKGDMGENRTRYDHIRTGYLAQKDPL